MTWKTVPVAEKERLAALYRQGVPLHHEATRLGMKPASLERQVRSYLYYRRLFLGSVSAEISIPQSPSRQYLDYEVLDGDDWLIISDIEVPDHDPRMLKLALLAAMARGIKRCVINGDLIATDQDALNAWVTTWKHGDETGYEQAVGLVVNLLDEYARWFEEIVIIEGNHDDRIARKTGGEVHLGMFLRGTIARYSRYAYLYLRTSERGYIKCVHPKNFSSDPVKLGQELYDVEHGPGFDRLHPFETAEKCHFVVAHCHRQQSGFSKDGVYEIHATGTLRDPERTKYKSQGSNKYRQWDQGFLVVQHGHFYPMTLHGTDWQRELGELYEHSPFGVAYLP